MTNFENKKDECMKILAHDMALVDGKPTRCSNSICYKCDFRTSSDSCSNCAKKWLTPTYEEPTPKLTKREREFLECFNCKDKHAILRHVNGKLFVQNVTYGICEAGIYSEMFPFIEPGKAWTFEDLLKLEVEE